MENRSYFPLWLNIFRHLLSIFPKKYANMRCFWFRPFCPRHFAKIRNRIYISFCVRLRNLLKITVLLYHFWDHLGAPSTFKWHHFWTAPWPWCKNPYLPKEKCWPTNPCKNGGICNGVDGSCHCINGWTGSNCQTPKGHPEMMSILWANTNTPLLPPDYSFMLYLEIIFTEW